MNKTILVLHGPNLHLLGQREPDVYGNTSLEKINKKIKAKAKSAGITIDTYQSNQEGQIIDKITKSDYDLIIINPAAYTHTSIAIRDALAAIKKPAIEVHLSNIYKREDFRKKSLISDVVLGTISGFGENSYYLAIDAAAAIFAGD
ncbi:MAG: type II 3-dehydroquinate dehydratase [Candidatus Omnitrophica bacterium]|nr:type II 3-dehydroquinate dehydratase [Candidatus Omnitrophota bacterium]MCF7891416.1 type II 3-dehydroquinate dehydratase [Candidatus Omnitrophota bacterium]MCF7895804.1 type II 3-dehydroquinate dehydratase [Candidatus Omnitrophota bacterium]MCF7898111.1 type II 3-dehydroquinate dehydratase [Candidatus Omnitrophota bacterium]MCF7908999.1 type II 3-dehydroquinate dehydratase [Candidatus Omnitrophota bacterium]